MGLHYDLSRFDGKGIAALQEIFRANNPPSDDVLDTLVDVIGFDDTNMQIGSAFLLRHYVEAGFALGPERVARLATNLEAMPDGFGRLHLCRAMNNIEVPAEHAEAFADFFRACLVTKNTFLRAWAPHGFFQLALQHGQYREEAEALVVEALSDPAPSVRARARKTLAGE